MEILAPAGNMECAKAAIDNGANAIYLGYTAFSARDGAENFDEESLKSVLTQAHFAGVKVYVAMNTMVKAQELDIFVKTLLCLWNMGADAIILQDMLLGKYLHETYPEIVLHLSTQAGVCSAEGAELAKEYGFSRVILARETPIKEIETIAKIVETEVFIQGALCSSYSGQCYFSSFAGGNSGNRGRCKQPCRKKYCLDRKGYEERAYALSLSDLCVGEDILKLAQLGVASFKIEGRMRRKEYVGAAVKYYRMLLDGGYTEAEKTAALSDLKRAYNRGNYTKGLAFSQDKRFLSRAVQGHLGEKVGVVTVLNGKYFVESVFKATQGDAFKILRDGQEVGGALFVKSERRGFTISAKSRLRNGDSVFVTTDTAANARTAGTPRIFPLSLSLRFAVGERAQISGGGVTVRSEAQLSAATSSPLTEEELKNNFLKVDGLPIAVKFEKASLSGSVFIARSQLNALRRAFYAKLCEKIVKGDRKELSFLPLPQACFTGENGKTAVISDDFTGIEAEIGIYKPSDYSAPLSGDFEAFSGEKYLYFPAFHSGNDILRAKALVKENALDGLYIENYDGLKIVEEIGCKAFVGTGLNLANPIAIKTLLENPNVRYYAVSKELSERESAPLIGKQSFALGCGDIKLMDLIYCPFERTCGSCDKRQLYTLTDENSREFPVRRVLSADGACRFEVYNCASLIGKGVAGAGTLIEVTVQSQKTCVALAANDERAQKEIFRRYTAGHAKNGVL
ncbi:MAG: U32 family peptidase [Clostridia bacterium]|nr:U32 family peptidase [Clostridia bacterium]